jgi:ribosomal protein S18 acetylase RimI-like enzyme
LTLQTEFGSNLALNQKLTIARLVFEAFGETSLMLMSLLGGKTKAVVFIALCLRQDRLIVALKQNLVVGFSGLEYQGKNFIDVNVHQAVRMLGFRGFLVYTFSAIAFLLNKPLPSDLHIQALAVSADQRGQGIGTKLLKDSIDFARANNFSKVKIEVTSANPKAERLYRRIGFKIFSVRKIPYPLSFLSGLDNVTELFLET